MQKSLEEHPIECLKRSAPPRQAPPVKKQSPQPKERELPVFRAITLIDRAAAAAASREGVSLLAKECLDNILIDLLPSLAEIADRELFSRRVFEKTKLLLEQSLKFALSQVEGAAL